VSSIPVLSLESLRADDARIGAALVEFGFLVLENHGIPAAYWEPAFAAAARAFALPAGVKARYRGPDDGSQRGYLELRTELGGGRDALDRKESWHVRPNGHRFANIFPDEVPEFGPRMLALVDALDALAVQILAGIDAFLAKPPGHFARAVQGSDSLFRVNFYPESTAGVPRDRFLAHRDFDLITLLLGANRPGLEIQARDGRWWPLTPSSASIVVNAGDILALESRDRIPSAPHRVVSPPRPDGGRISMVYFVSPRREVRLDNGVSAGEFIDARLRDAGYLR
jgi:isopenicillin N synthase-like dioxygenase